MTLEELETIIRFDETQVPAEVYTASPRVRKLLARYGLQPYRADRDRQGKEVSWYYHLDKRAIALKPGNRLIRIGKVRTAVKSHSKAGSVAKS